MSVIPFRAPSRRAPKPKPPRALRAPCTACGGKGWLAVQYTMPGNASTQSTVRICDCMREKPPAR